MLKLSAKGFKAAIIIIKKNVLTINYKFPWKKNSAKKKKCTHTQKVIKEPKGNMKQENTVRILKICCWLGSVVRLK